MKTRKAFLLLTVVLSATLTSCAIDPTYSQPAPYGYGRTMPLLPDSAWLIHDLTRVEAYRLARERGLIQ